jgi:hypothetical protein
MAGNWGCRCVRWCYQQGSCAHMMTTYSPYAIRAATMVAAEFVINQAQTLRGCSARRYQVAVNMENSGMLAASNNPRRNRHAKRLAGLLQAAMQAAEVPQQKTKMVIRYRGLKRTMMNAEKGCQQSVAIEVIDEAREYCCFLSPRSSDRPKELP